jgi:hypothetical protein
MVLSPNREWQNPNLVSNFFSSSLTMNQNKLEYLHILFQASLMFQSKAEPTKVEEPVEHY